jgi:hypothetical protein
MQFFAATLPNQLHAGSSLQTSFMLGAASCCQSCVGLAALSLLKDCMQPKDLTGVQFLGYTNNYINYDTHTLAQKHLIELLMWNASNVHKHFIKT